MEWSDIYPANNQPSFDDISKYINSGLWHDLNSFLQDAYHVQPKLSYSQCSMQRGWNVKYQKGGKSLCTLYPMENFFIALIVIGNKELHEAGMLIPLCSKYTQQLYQQTSFSTGGRWLMINITGRPILDDVIKLIRIRVRPKKYDI